MLKVRPLSDLMESSEDGRSLDDFEDGTFDRKIKKIPTKIKKNEETPQNKTTTGNGATRKRAATTTKKKKALPASDLDETLVPKSANRCKQKEPPPNQKRIDNYFKSCAKTYRIEPQAESISPSKKQKKTIARGKYARKAKGRKCLFDEDTISETSCSYVSESPPKRKKGSNKKEKVKILDTVIDLCLSEDLTPLEPDVERDETLKNESLDKEQNKPVMQDLTTISESQQNVKVQENAVSNSVPNCSKVKVVSNLKSTEKLGKENITEISNLNKNVCSENNSEFKIIDDTVESSSNCSSDLIKRYITKNQTCSSNFITNKTPSDKNDNELNATNTVESTKQLESNKTEAFPNVQRNLFFDNNNKTRLQNHSQQERSVITSTPCSTHISESLSNESDDGNRSEGEEIKILSTTIADKPCEITENDCFIDLTIDDELTPPPKCTNKLPKNTVQTTLKKTSTNAKVPRAKKISHPCPPYKVVENTTFAVDAFRYGQIENVTHYFLTHFHADHYIGLTRKFSMPLYLSPITARLLRKFIPIEEQFIHEIELYKPIIVENVEITAIDANHCPGAVMFVFKLATGKCILHTGDFRASAEMESEPIFWNNDISTIYLDTTYISQKYAFCTQIESIDRAIGLIEEFQIKHFGARVLYVCGSYLIGKEKFWSSLANKFEFKVWPDERRRAALDAMQVTDFTKWLVDDPYQANMHVVPIGKLSYQTLVEYLKSYENHFDVLLAIRPSGWEKNSKPQWRGKVNIIGIEYSEHSGHSELKRFVSYLKPMNVISTVPVSSNPMVTAKIPQKWYKYDKLSNMNRDFQTSITSYLKFNRSKNASNETESSKDCGNSSKIVDTSTLNNISECELRLMKVSPIKRDNALALRENDVSDISNQETCHEPLDEIEANLRQMHSPGSQDADDDWLS